jgi:uncharacterized BrkB/YihY/UPF0761 family membrane protein
VAVAGAAAHASFQECLLIGSSAVYAEVAVLLKLPFFLQIFAYITIIGLVLPFNLSQFKQKPREKHGWGLFQWRPRSVRLGQDQGFE